MFEEKKTRTQEKNIWSRIVRIIKIIKFGIKFGRLNWDRILNHQNNNHQNNNHLIRAVNRKIEKSKSGLTYA
jgi:hypothetical protein